MDMRRVLFSVLAFFLVGASTASAEISFVPGEFAITIDGLPVTMSTPIVNSGGVAMVPARLLAIEGGYRIGYELGRYVFYDGNDDVVLAMTVGYKTVIYKGEKAVVERPIVIEDNTLYVPARPIAQMLGLVLDYDSTKNAIAITKPKKQENWAEKIVKKFGLENIIYACFGVTAFFMLMFFILTPIRRRKQQRS